MTVNTEEFETGSAFKPTISLTLLNHTTGLDGQGRPTGTMTFKGLKDFEGRPLKAKFILEGFLATTNALATEIGTLKKGDKLKIKLIEEENVQQAGLMSFLDVLQDTKALPAPDPELAEDGVTILSSTKEFEGGVHDYTRKRWVRPEIEYDKDENITWSNMTFEDSYNNPDKEKGGFVPLKSLQEFDSEGKLTFSPAAFPEGFWDNDRNGYRVRTEEEKEQYKIS